MIFESRTDAPPVSEAYEEAAELFAAGRARAARTKAAEAGPWRLEGDVLLCADLERAGSFHRRYFATIALGARHFLRGRSPDDCIETAPLLAIERARVATIRGRWQAAVERIEALLDSARRRTRDDDAERLVPLVPLLEALLASAWAQIGLGERAAFHRERALEAAADLADARVFYELGYAEVCLRRWDEAAMHGVKAVELAPRWARARVFLAESLLSRGRVDDAVRIVHRPLRRGLEDATLELLAGLQALHLGDHDRALRLLIHYETSWGRVRRDESLAELLPRLPWRFRDPEVVLAELEAVRPELAATIRDRPPAPHRQVALPAVRQEHLLCLPTAVAMVAAPQHVTLDPRELFEAADGRDGTPTWRMVEVLRQRHWEVRFVRARLDVVRSLLDQGVALIGPLEGLFENHVEVLCGEDEALGLLSLRDPESWTPGLLPTDRLEERYALSGGGLIAVLSGSTLARVAFPPDSRALEAEALVALERACARGEVEAAERAAAAIDDASPAAVRRDLVGRGVTATPGEVGRRLLAVAADPERHPLSRLRAILTLERTDLLDDVLESVSEDDVLGRGGRRLVEMARLRADGRWDQVERLCADLLGRFPQLETLWIYRAEAAARSGRLSEAREHLERALELAPESPAVRSLARRLLEAHRPAAERVEELRDLLSREPWHHDLRRELAQAIAALGDGLGFERAVRDLQRVMPRLPAAWSELASWYLAQDRDDLARATLEEARRKIDDDELPLWSMLEDESDDGGDLQEDDDLPAGLTEAERETLWLRARQEVLGEVDGTAAFDRLRALDDERRLTWWESAHRVALELHLTLEHRAREAPRVEEGVDEPTAEALGDLVRDALPARLDGPPLSALHALVQAAEPERLPRPAVAELLRWVEGRIAETRPDDPDDLPPELDLALARLQEGAGDLSAAEERYRRLSDELPWASSRLGDMLAARGELAAAADAHRRALAAEPGLGASVETLIGIFRALGDGPDELVMLAARCRLLPYSAAALQELAEATRAQRGLDAAFAEIAARADGHRPETLAVLRASLHLDEADAHEPDSHGRFSEASSTAPGALDEHRLAAVEELSTRDTVDEVEPYRTLSCRVRLLRARGAPEEALERVEAALADEPEQPWLLRLHGLVLADLLAETVSPDEAARRSREALLRGVGDPVIAHAWLSRTAPPRGPRVVELLEEVAERPRPALERLAYACLAALDEIAASVDDRLTVLRWCRRRLPHSEPLREMLVGLLSDAGEAGDALDEAEQLLALDPESPPRQALVARCLLAVDPRRSRELLERSVARTGALDDLLQIAFAHHRLGEVDDAIATYRQVVERRPDHELALLNLAFLGVDDDLVWSGLSALLERPAAAAVPSLHVLAVDLARARGDRVPTSWEVGARQRFDWLAERARSDSGAELEADEADERLRLGLALARWLDTRGDGETTARIEASRVREEAGPWWRRVRLALWPGARWLPVADADADADADG